MKVGIILFQRALTAQYKKGVLQDDFSIKWLWLSSLNTLFSLKKFIGIIKYASDEILISRGIDWVLSTGEQLEKAQKVFKRWSLFYQPHTILYIPPLPHSKLC